jgi:hypothetical protein
MAAASLVLLPPVIEITAGSEGNDENYSDHGEQ